ncbi:STAS domain-containing protein [Dyella sp. 2HG41-7]|uniref:STAS domain-containing protein n=1 Tax=Dyella sp. 2HG41-7 TaxID=2883239 RepID=UPI001F27C6EE|nr:STAS domain-containing protein [Dyella sp. 2HG41-7]
MAPSKSGQFRVSSDVPDTVSVSGTLNFATAAGALEAMRSAFAKNDRHTLDLSDVDTCDSAGLACVLAALSEADNDGRHVVVRHVPAGMQALARVCGVEPFLH